MADTTKADAYHVDHLNPDHEPLLTGALALANLFSNCVEAFGMIYPSHKSEDQEQLLLSQLGIQQARLLIWGQAVGITSPPSVVTDRAVPRHPSLAYPDLTEPTFFGARDERLDEPEIRVTVENALAAIIDRPISLSKEELMSKFGLKPPKKTVAERQVALDFNRLEAHREKFELLKEVAESYAAISTRRASIARNKWVISDVTKFAAFIENTREKVDSLIDLLGNKDAIDRGMRMDIRSFGWHLSDDRYRAAQDAAKLHLIAAACRDRYPEYVEATQQALQQMAREARENRGESSFAMPVASGRRHSEHAPETEGDLHAKHDKGKRPGIMKLFRSFRRGHEATSPIDHGPPRSQSDAGPTLDPLHADANEVADDGSELVPIRSKSVGAIMQVPISALNEHLARTTLADGRKEDHNI